MRQKKQPNQKLGRRPKQTLLQRRHKDSEKAHEKMLNIANYQRDVNQNYNEKLHHTGQNGHHQMATINAGEGVEKRECSCTLSGNVN